MAILKAVKAGSIKPASNGQLTLELVRNSEWYRNRQGKASQKKSDVPWPVDEFANIDKIDLEKKLIAERTEALRLDNEERKKNLLPADEVRGAMEAIISTTRSHLLLLPAKLAHRVAALTDPAECQAVVDTEIRAALKALSETTL